MITHPGNSRRMFCRGVTRRKVLDLVAAVRPVAQVAHDLQTSAQVIHTWRGQRLIDIGQLPGAISRGPFPSYFRISNTIFTARSRSSLWYFRCADMTLHRSRDQSLQHRGGAGHQLVYRLALQVDASHPATPTADPRRDSAGALLPLAAKSSLPADSREIRRPHLLRTSSTGRRGEAMPRPGNDGTPRRPRINGRPSAPRASRRRPGKSVGISDGPAARQ